MKRIAGKIKAIFPGREIQVIPIENRFFGERITVSGLITGQDLAGQLADKELGARLVLPCSMFRSGEEVFLDDMTKTELSERLSVPIEIAPSEGAALIRLLLDPAAEEDRAWGSGIYEPESEEEIGSENGGLA